MEMSQGNSLYSYLKQKCLSLSLSFFTKTEQEGRTGIGTSGREEDVRKGCRKMKTGENTMYTCM
jgi:hypothetical protein